MLRTQKSVSTLSLSTRKKTTTNIQPSLYRQQKATMASSFLSKESENPQVLYSSIGNARVVELNRPKALNSLNQNMARDMIPQYKQIKSDGLPKVVMMKGAGEKAFCAGGDVVAIAQEGKEGGSLPETFFHDEYQLDHLIASLEGDGISHIALLNGITMGGGVGLSVHGKFRVATESTLYAMPETGIGFFPDVGGSYFLPRLPGSTGMFMGLTGHRLKGKDTVRAGIATHFVPEAKLNELEEAIGDLSSPSFADVEKVLDQFSELKYDQNKDYREDQEADASLRQAHVIDQVFSKDSVEEIMESLEAVEKEGGDGAEMATGALKLMRRASPSSLKVAHRQIKEGRNKSLRECFAMEYRISQTFMAKNDFYEGIRAQLIDKDRNPQWKPTELTKVTDAEVNEYFTRDAPWEPLNDYDRQ